MIQKLKTLIISLSLLLSFTAPVVLATPSAMAADINSDNIHNSLCNGSNINITNPGTTAQTNTCPADANGSNLQTLLTKVINVLSVLVGAIAVIMIIIAGFRYVTSAGNEQGVGAAKKTILYALIGLVIVALSQLIVHFVLNNVNF